MYNYKLLDIMDFTKCVKRKSPFVWIKNVPITTKNLWKLEL